MLPNKLLQILCFKTIIIVYFVMSLKFGQNLKEAACFCFTASVGRVGLRLEDSLPSWFSHEADKLMSAVLPVHVSLSKEWLGWVLKVRRAPRTPSRNRIAGCNQASEIT